MKNSEFNSLEEMLNVVGTTKSDIRRQGRDLPEQEYFNNGEFTEKGRMLDMQYNLLSFVDNSSLYSDNENKYHLVISKHNDGVSTEKSFA
jgi:hypothetical protein